MLVAKSDNLWKHQGRKTTRTLCHGVPIGEKHMNRNFFDNHNEGLFVVIPIYSICIQVGESIVRDSKKTWIQFVTLLYLLKRWRHVTYYEQMYVLLENLNFKNNSHHHQGENSGWVVLKRNFAKCQFSLFCDEVTSVDYQS